MSNENRIRSKEEIQELFKKMRTEESEYDIKPILEKPTNPGQYTIEIEGVKTIKALTLNFDGNNWVGLDEFSKMADGNLEKISYYDKKPANNLTNTSIDDAVKTTTPKL